MESRQREVALEVVAKIILFWQGGDAMLVMLNLTHLQNVWRQMT